MKPGYWAGLLAPVCFAALLFSAPGQACGADQRVRTAQQALNTAQTKFNNAQQAWNKAQQDLTKAQAAHQTSSNRLHQARQTAAQKHAADLGMTAAASERDAASRQMEARRNSIEAELKTLREYQAAEKEADAARARLGDLPDDKSLTPAQQQTLGSELAAKLKRPTEMRKEAGSRDPAMQQAVQRWQSAEKKIAELQPKLKKAIDSDPAVTKAVQEEKQTLAALEKARNAATRAEQDASTAQANLDRHNQQLQAAIAQSRPARHR